MDFASLGTPSEATRGDVNSGGEGKKVLSLRMGWLCLRFPLACCVRENSVPDPRSKGGRLSLGYAWILLCVCLFLVAADEFRISVFVACSVVNACVTNAQFFLGLKQKMTPSVGRRGQIFRFAAERLLLAIFHVSTPGG